MNFFPLSLFFDQRKGLTGNGGYPTELIAYTSHSDFDSLFGEDKPTNDFLFSFLPNHKNTKYKYIQDYVGKFQEISEEWELFLGKNIDWLIFSTILKPFFNPISVYLSNCFGVTYSLTCKCILVGCRY